VRNLLLVAASIETPPEELAGIADEVLVLMPWGALLRGVVRGEPEVCGGLRRVARTGATVEVTIGTSIWSEPVPAEIRDLPELTDDYVRDWLAPRWARAGLRIATAELVTAGAEPRLATSWARRLNSGRAEQFRHLTAVAE
jgi:16S rRNA (adenine(1408)-N(1))-methyltransferase